MGSVCFDVFSLLFVSKDTGHQFLLCKTRGNRVIKGELGEISYKNASNPKTYILKVIEMRFYVDFWCFPTILWSCAMISG